MEEVGEDSLIKYGDGNRLQVIYCNQHVVVVGMKLMPKEVSIIARKTKGKK